jgi:hypothetical protein
MSIKKITAGIILGAVAMVLLAGCGTKKSTSDSTVPKMPEEAVVPKTFIDPKAIPRDAADSLSLPSPTGGVDDTVNAIMNEANGEQVKATNDENDAKASADGSDETNNLSNSYDQNEL